MLWNGVGTPRLLASLAGGAGETQNYASILGGTGTKPEGYGTRRPSSVSAWHDWYTYSEGTTMSTLNYYTEQKVSFTWTYRSDGIIEMVYSILNDSGVATSTLMSRTKVPDAEYYDTLIHGDYVRMTFNKISLTQKETLTDVIYKGMKEGTREVYAENEMLALDSFNVSAKYMQTGDTERPVTTYDIEASTDGTTWVSLSTHPLSCAYTQYRVSLTVGNTTKTDAIDLGTDDWFTVIPNAFSEGFGADITVNGHNFVNNGGIGSISYALDKLEEEDVVKLTVTGFAQSLEEGLKAAFAESAANDYTHYIAIKLFANADASQFQANGVTVKAGATTLPIVAQTTNGSELDLVIALTKDIVTGEDAIVIENLISGSSSSAASTKYVLDVSGLVGFEVTSKVTTTGDLYLNIGGDVTIEYQISDELYDSIASTKNFIGISVNNQMGYLNDAALVGTTRTLTIGSVKAEVETSALESEKKLTVKYTLPAANPENVTSYSLVLTTPEGSVDVRQALDVINYDLEFHTDAVKDPAGHGNNTSYVKVDGTNLYFMFAAEKTNVTLNEIVNDINTAAAPFNIGTYGVPFVFAIKNDHGTLVLDIDGLPEDSATCYLSVLGTADDARDTDTGYVFTVKIDTTKFGVASDATVYYFDVPKSVEGTTLYYFKASKVENAWKLEQKTASVTAEDLVLLHEGTCRESSIYAYAVKDGGTDVVLYGGATKVGGSHQGSGTCDLCGAAISNADISAADNSIHETLHDGEYVRVRGTYNGTPHANDYNGIETRVQLPNNTWIRVRNDGYYVLETNNGGATLLYNSTGAGNSVNGQKDLIDGEEITVGSSGNYNEAKLGGTFDVTASFEDGVVIVLTQLYRAGDSTPWWQYVAMVQITGYPEVQIGFRIDNNGADKLDTTANVEKWKGEVAHSDISAVAHTQMTQGSANFDSTQATYAVAPKYYTEVSEAENRFGRKSYTVVAASGNAEKLEANEKTDAAFTNATYYATLKITLAHALPENSKVEIKTLDGTKYAEAHTSINTGRTEIDILVGLDGSISELLLDITNFAGSTMQSDIVLDFSALALSEITEATEASALTVAGGTVTVTYTGLPADKSDLTVQMGGVSYAWSDLADKDFDNGVSVQSVAGDVLTLKVEKPDYKHAIEEYELLLKKDGLLVARSTFAPIAMPEDNLIAEDYYVSANGSDLTFVKAITSANDSDALYLNANGGTATVGENYTLLALYDLSYHVNASGYHYFDANNPLAANGTIILSQVGSSRVAAITVSLSTLNIGESTAYAFQLVGEKSTTIADYYTVSAARAIVKGTQELNGSVEQLSYGSCTGGNEQVGIKAALLTDNYSFYYNVDVAPSHAWKPATQVNGMLVCEDCGAISDNSASIQAHYVSPKLLEGVAENGITISFWMSAALADDWQSCITVGQNGFNIGTPCIDPWNMKTDITNGGMGATPEERALMGDVRGTNAWPGSAGASAPFGVSPYNAGASYVTIVLDPGEARTDGLRFYRDGVLAIDYSATGKMNNNQPIWKYVQLLLLGMERVGFYATPSDQIHATNLHVMKGVLTAEQIANRYTVYNLEKNALTANTYSYSHGSSAHQYPETGHTQICEICGSVKSNHTHEWMTETHRCYYCNELAPATDGVHTFDPTTERCSVCGAINPAHTNHIWDSATHKCTICGEVAPADYEHHVFGEDGLDATCHMWKYEDTSKVGYSKEAEVTNGDTQLNAWNGDGATWTVSGDFALRLSYSQTEAYTDNLQWAAIRFANGATEYVNVRFFTWGNNKWDTWGEMETAGTRTITLEHGSDSWTTDDDIKANLPTNYVGDYLVLATRIGTDLSVKCTLTNTDGEVYTITYSYANFTPATITSVVLTCETVKLSPTFHYWLATLSNKE